MARRLLLFSSTLTLALNIAEPLIAGHYGKAAFDAVGPLLLIGWAEVGPSLLQAMQTTTARTIALAGQAADDSNESIVADRLPVPQVHGLVGAEAQSVEQATCRDGPRAREQDLLHRARAEDVLHWRLHHRPISAETLRKRLRVGASTARGLATRLAVGCAHPVREGGDGPAWCQQAHPPPQPQDPPATVRAAVLRRWCRPRNTTADAGFTRADGHRLAAAVLDSGKRLTTVVVSHGDPDFYFGAEVLADAFPDARFVATEPVIEHIHQSYEGKLKAWAALGANLPTRLVDLAPLSGGLTLEDHRFDLRGGPAELPDRHYLWQPERRAILGGVLLFQQEHVWVADTPTPGDRAAWIDLLDEMAALQPELVVPGHRLPGTAADASAIGATRDYLLAFEEELGAAADGAALNEALVSRYPDHGMLIAAQIGAKVAKGEMAWG